MNEKSRTNKNSKNKSVLNNNNILEIEKTISFGQTCCFMNVLTKGPTAIL
jgi:hypothetical protein